jgi:hypothetical protein
MQTTQTANPPKAEKKYETPPPPLARGQHLLTALFRSPVTLGDKSPIGAVLERAALFADHSVWDWDKNEVGMRVSVMRRSCRRCRGTGLDREKMLAWEERKETFEALFGKERDYEEFCKKSKCERCSGSGEVGGRTSENEITVGRQGVTRGWVEMREPTDAAVMTLAQSTRVMIRVGQMNPIHRLALLIYHGEEGDHCEGQHANRLTSIMPLAWKSATKLLLSKAQEHGAKKGIVETYKRLTENFRAMDERRSQFIKGEQSAHELLCAATESWGVAYDEILEARRRKVIDLVEKTPELVGDIETVEEPMDFSGRRFETRVEAH